MSLTDEERNTIVKYELEKPVKLCVKKAITTASTMLHPMS